MGTDIASGVSSPTPDAVQPSTADPALAGVTPVAPGERVPTPEAAITSQQQERDAAGLAAATAAHTAGMDARNSMLGHYEAQALPLGGQIGDNLILPVVPDNAVVAASSDQYPWPGDEPVPSSAGPGYGGNEPTT